MEYDYFVTRNHNYFLSYSFKLVLVFLFLLTHSRAFTKPIGILPNPIPVNGNFLGPVGFIFPGLPSAACVNAATLPNNEALTSLQLAYSPTRGEEPQNFYTGIATASKSFGFGFGYFGSIGEKKSTDGGFVGFGFKSNASQYGLTYKNENLTANSLGDFDISYLYTDLREGLSYGGILHSINKTPQLGLGLGYVYDKTFNIESNVLTPKANQFSGGDFTIITASNFSISQQIILHLQVNYSTKKSHIEPTMAVNYWLSDFTNVILQFTSPQVWSFGFSLIL